MYRASPRIFVALLPALLLVLLPFAAFAASGFPDRGPAPLATGPGVPAPPSPAANTVPVHYLVVKAGDALPPRVTFYRQVEMEGPFESLTEEATTNLVASLSTRQDHAVELRLRNAKGETVYRAVQRVPRWRRGESLLDADDPRVKERGTRLGMYHEQLEEVTFAIRVPVIDGATDLQVSYGPDLLRTRTPLDLASLAAEFAGAGEAVSEAISGAVFEAVPGYNHGGSGNRVDILILAEGYRSIDEHWFRVDSDAMIAGFMADRPFSDYPTHFNFWRLFVPSIANGADRPACDDPDAGNLDTGFTANTYFDATYCTDDQWRLLTIDENKALQVASEYPHWDQIIALVQSPYRGGSGGSVSVTAMDTGYTASNDVVGVMQHEFAHSFAGLADEYETENLGYPACSDLNASSSDNCEPNVTDVYYRSGIKWKHWISSSTSIPTGGALGNSLAAGLWEGARYLTDDMYRSCFNGLMRDSEEDFCYVGRERMIVSMYQGGWGSPGGGVSTIEPGSRSPAATTLYRNPSQAVTLSARTFAPVGGPDLTVEWYINNALVRTSTVAPGATSSYTFSNSLPGFTWNIRMKVIDNNSILHNSTRRQVAKEVSWVVHITGGGGCQTCAQGDGGLGSAELMEEPAQQD